MKLKEIKVKNFRCLVDVSIPIEGDTVLVGENNSGKTALLDRLCKKMRDDFEIEVVTNDIYTREDAEFLVRSEALEADRIVGWKRAAARIPLSVKMRR